MFWNQIANWIYFALAICWFANVHAIFYRWWYVDFSTSPCRGREFELVRLRRPSEWSHIQKRLLPKLSGGTGGWLTAVIRQPSVVDASVMTHDLLRRQNTYDWVLDLTMGTGTLFGLMGTVSGLLGAASLKDAAIFNAFLTTFLGIAVTLPPLIYRGIVSSRRDLLERQLEDFATALQSVGHYHARIEKMPESRLDRGSESAESEVTTAARPQTAERVKKRRSPQISNHPYKFEQGLIELVKSELARGVEQTVTFAVGNVANIIDNGSTCQSRKVDDDVE